jgi:hypothetical protein
VSAGEVGYQCARCGSSVSWVDCSACGGEGCTAPGELYEEDPLWYDEDDTKPCHQCGGAASWPVCLSDAAWCEANPLPGRAGVKRGEVETFTIERSPSPATEAKGGRDGR